MKSLEQQLTEWLYTLEGARFQNALHAYRVEWMRDLRKFRSRKVVDLVDCAFSGMDHFDNTFRTYVLTKFVFEILDHPCVRKWFYPMGGQCTGEYLHVIKLINNSSQTSLGEGMRLFYRTNPELHRRVLMKMGENHP